MITLVTGLSILAGVSPRNVPSDMTCYFSTHFYPDYIAKPCLKAVFFLIPVQTLYLFENQFQLHFITLTEQIISDRDHVVHFSATALWFRIEFHTIQRCVGACTIAGEHAYQLDVQAAAPVREWRKTEILSY